MHIKCEYNTYQCTESRLTNISAVLLNVEQLSSYFTYFSLSLCVWTIFSNKTIKIAIRHLISHWVPEPIWQCMFLVISVLTLGVYIINVHTNTHLTIYFHLYLYVYVFIRLCRYVRYAFAKTWRVMKQVHWRRKIKKNIEKPMGSLTFEGQSIEPKSEAMRKT